MKGKTKVNGHYISAKVGINFNENYNLELEHAKHKGTAIIMNKCRILGWHFKFSQIKP
jgi:hypothetical protein